MMNTSKEMGGAAVSIVGLASTDSKWIQPAMLEKIRQAKSIVGSSSKIAKLSWLIEPNQEVFAFPSPMVDIFDQIPAMAKPVVVLASGDPGFFGIVRLAGERLPKDSFEVFPNASSVAWAFARLGINWEDATVISFHGRNQNDSLDELARVLNNPNAMKFALISSPTYDGRALGQTIATMATDEWEVHIFSEILSEQEGHFAFSTKAFSTKAFSTKAFSIESSPRELEGQLAGENLDFAVVIAIRKPDRIDTIPRRPTTSSSLQGISHLTRPSAFSSSAFITQDNPFTKPEVRAVILSKLQIDRLEPHARLVDLGAGVGTVGISALALRPDLIVTFVEKNPHRLDIIRRNLNLFGYSGNLIQGDNCEFPEVISNSEAIFLGGGFSDFEKIESQVPHNSSFAVASASLDHANRAGALLGNLCQVSVSHSVSLVDGTLRLVSDNPVFISWREVNQHDT